ncbi:integral membrane protein [Zalerion maritima]|uniref:Integral membrane protein n=1 Tax=Zalerion maritima TaxID=339359 RepID=A0AAD5WQH6_9PEZI|nr:integral membrane protein [Zalerion maritima]
MIWKLIGGILRVVELVFAAIVAGVLGSYLDDVEGKHVHDLGRFIYAVVVAGLAILFSLIWLLPFVKGFLHWPADIFMSILWWVAFGLLVDYIGDDCGYVFDWDNIRIREGSTCQKWKASIAFCFLSAICFLVSAIVGFLAMRHMKKEHRRDHATTHRRWYQRRSRV